MKLTVLIDGEPVVAFTKKGADTFELERIDMDRANDDFKALLKTPKLQATTHTEETSKGMVTNIMGTTEAKRLSEAWVNEVLQQAQYKFGLQIAQS